MIGNKCQECGKDAQLGVSPSSGTAAPLFYCRDCATKLAHKLNLPALLAQLEANKAETTAMQTSDLPPEYYEGVHAMDEGARAWMRAHPFAEPRIALGPFESEMKKRAGRPEHENVMIAASLAECIDKIALNADGRALLRAMDEASGFQATYFQAKVLIEMQIEEQVKRGQGQMPAGDWRCAGCAKLLDGFSNVGGQVGVPPPGTPSVCMYCAQVQRINEAGDGWERVSDAELRAMPRALRMQLHELRNVMQKRVAEEARRS